MQALGEMSIMYPVSGGFYNLTGRFLDPAFAFANGWNYVLQWAVSIPLEITVAVSVVLEKFRIYPFIPFTGNYRSVLDRCSPYRRLDNHLLGLDQYVNSVFYSIM